MKKLKDKELCKLVKDDALETHWREYLALVQHAGHICRKCGRVARDKARLCKPEKLD